MSKDVIAPHMSTPRPSPSPAPASTENEQSEVVPTEFGVVQRDSNGETSNIAAAESPSTSRENGDDNAGSTEEVEQAEATGLNYLCDIFQ